MRTTRRAFLSHSAAGAGLLGLGPSLGTAAAAATADVPPPGASVAGVPTPDERRTLIHAAHFGRKQPATSRQGMAICTHPLASNEAIQMLRAGGNAADAALSAAITQTVVEPHMTTLTGCLCFLYFDAASGELSYCNGNVNAPLAPLPGFAAADLEGGRGVAVPGFWGGFEAAHQRFGKLPRRRLMDGAIRYARDGFETHPFLWGEIFSQCHKIGLTAQGREIYMPDGALPRPGEMLFQRRAADTLERLAEEGSDYFYRGAFAEELVRVAAEAGGVLTREDLERYAVRWQPPAESTYRGDRVVGSPPPDNGGTHIIEMLNMIEILDLAKLGPPTESSEVLYQMALIHNAVYAEGANQRDPESHPLPLEVIVSKEYARSRFELLQMGNPKSAAAAAVAYPGSNHVTVADARGNVCTILHSCMSLPWSNGLFAHGVSICAAGAHFFRVMPEPGHRISAYVAPNMVLRNGKPILASGSPSVGLLANIVQNTVNLLDFGLEIGESVHRPRFGGHSINPVAPTASMIEVDIDEKVREEAAAKGLAFDVVNPWNWHHGSFEGIWMDPDSGEMSACGDPRRTAQALPA